MDDQAVIERLRSDLRAERAAATTTTPGDLLDAGRRRSHQRQVRRRAGAGIAAVAVVLVGVGLVAGRGADDESVDTGPADTAPIETTTTLIPVATTAAQPDLPTGPPAQTPEEAARDGIVPAIAELPFPLRVTALAEAVTPEGRWVISRPSEALRAPAIPDGGLGDTDGTYMVDWIHPYDAVEVLLIAPDDRIVRAYPMSQVSPSWLLVTPDAILGGRIADGGQPYFTLFRIDRRTLELTGMVFPDPEGFPATVADVVPPAVAPSWRVAPEGASLDGVLHEDPTLAGTPVTSAIGGDYRLDVAAAEALLAG